VKYCPASSKAARIPRVSAASDLAEQERATARHATAVNVRRSEMGMEYFSSY
jgi:hypothetical protein